MSFEDINKIKSTDFLVLKNTSDGTVDGVIAPNGLQVGLDGFTDKSLVVKTAVEIQSRTAPEDTGSKLYNIDGTLYFNGSEIGSGGGATASGSNGEFQFANASGDLDAAQVFWDSSKGKMFISGNLEVLGTETVIDTVHLHVEDTIIGLGTGSAGEGSAGDRGLIFLLGSETNPSFYWDESASEFRLARLTNVPGDTVFDDPTSVSAGGYQDFRLKTLHAVSGAVFDSNQRSLSTIGSDVFFYASGAIDSRGTSTRGTAVFGGDVVVSGTMSINRSDAGVSSMVTVTTDGKVGIGSDSPSHKLSVGGNMDLGEYLYHKNDNDTYIRFQDNNINIVAGGSSAIKLDLSTSKIQLNNTNSDLDTQIMADSGAVILHADAGNSRVGIGGTSGPHEALDVRGNIAATGFVSASLGLSGSLTRLVNQTSYIASGYDMNVVSSSNGQIVVSSNSINTRKKYVYQLTSSHSSENQLYVPSLDANSVEKNPNRIDVYVNGQLMASGTSKDYLLGPAATSLSFYFGLEVDDVITVRTY